MQRHAKDFIGIKDNEDFTTSIPNCTKAANVGEDFVISSTTQKYQEIVHKPAYVALSKVHRYVCTSLGKICTHTYVHTYVLVVEKFFI